MSRCHALIGCAANFLGTPGVEVRTVPGHSSADGFIKVPATVSLGAGDGPVRFQFDMTPDGARAFADLLVIAAAQAEQLVEVA